MARTTRSETARRSRTSARTNRGMYVDGNTVRRLAEVPERKRQPGRQNPGSALPNCPVHNARRVLRRYQGRNIS